MEYTISCIVMAAREGGDGMREIYLDNSATTPVDEKVREAMMEALGCYGNPSSLHSKGLEGERMVHAARKQVAKALGAKEQ